LAEGSILTDDFLRELMNVGEVDILVGVPTFNDAKTVGQVVQAIRAGLLKYFPRHRSVIINADGGSKDGTQDLVRAASISDLQHVSNVSALRTLHCISTQYPGGPASGTALQTILAAAELLRANASAVISPDATSIEPEWMERLLRPVSRDNFDLVTPVYGRHKFEGLLVRSLVYPMSRALYSKRVREPYPTEFAFSGRLGSHFLAQDIWSQEVGHIGAEIYLVISAIAGGFKLAQSFVGTKSRVMDHSSGDLVFAMRQTVGVLFWSLEQYFPLWSVQTESQPIPTIGAEHEISEEPIRVNRKRLHEMFVRGVAEIEPVLRSILSVQTLDDLKRAAAVPEENFQYSDELWVRTAYEFAASYHKAVISRDHIIQALAPLYRGKAYTFLEQNRDTTPTEMESNVEALCQTFERSKPYLLELWNGKK
jgi:glucosylglycerate synthase